MLIIIYLFICVEGQGHGNRTPRTTATLPTAPPNEANIIPRLFLSPMSSDLAEAIAGHAGGTPSKRGIPAGGWPDSGQKRAKTAASPHHAGDPPVPPPPPKQRWDLASDATSHASASQGQGWQFTPYAGPHGGPGAGSQCNSGNHFREADGAQQPNPALSSTAATSVPAHMQGSLLPHSNESYRQMYGQCAYPPRTVPSKEEIAAAVPPNASSVFHVLDRRIDLDEVTRGDQGGSLYGLLRAWVQDDPSRRILGQPAAGPVACITPTHVDGGGSPDREGQGESEGVATDGGRSRGRGGGSGGGTQLGLVDVLGALSEMSVGDGEGDGEEGTEAVEDLAMEHVAWAKEIRRKVKIRDQAAIEQARRSLKDRYGLNNLS